MGRLHFVQISDPHVTEPGTEILLRTALDRVRRMSPRPDWVVFTGDLIEGGTEEEFDVLQPAMASVPGTYHVVPGNHDGGNRGDYACYTRRFGPLHYAFDSGGYHCVVLDTCKRTGGEEDWHGEVAGPAMAWLADDLARVGRDRPVVLFHHHGLVGPTDDLSCDCANADEVLGLLDRVNLVAAFGGHAHALRRYERCGAPFFLAPNLSMTRSNAAGQPTGLLEVFLDGRDVHACCHIVTV